MAAFPWNLQPVVGELEADILLPFTNFIADREASVRSIVPLVTLDLMTSYLVVEDALALACVVFVCVSVSLSRGPQVLQCHKPRRTAGC